GHTLRIGPAALLPAPRPRMVDEDAPHHARRRAEKMPSPFDGHRAQRRQPQVGLMDQVRRLQRVLGAFVLQQAGRQAAQLAVDDGEQLLERGRIARVPPVQQMRDVTHIYGARAGHSSSRAPSRFFNEPRCRVLSPCIAGIPMTLLRACAFSLLFLLFNAGLNDAPAGSPPPNDWIPPVTLEACVSTQGYWTQHPEAWPLATLVLGDAAFPGH